MAKGQRLKAKVGAGSNLFLPATAGSVWDFGFRQDHGGGLTARFKGNVNGCAQGLGQAARPWPEVKPRRENARADPAVVNPL
jgi:hypothetical protein